MKLINFFSDKSYQGLGQPTPSKQQIPEWYRKSESTYTDSESPEEHAGLKKCFPYLDGLMAGYMLVTPFDIFIKEGEDGKLDVQWSGPEILNAFVNERPRESGALMPRPEGYHYNHMVWSGFWGVKTPKNWSILVTHPLNRFDLPFITTSAIIDSDEFAAPGNIPFFIKKGFTGVIPKGTPFAQLIPIKRASWKMVPNNQGLVNLKHHQGALVRQPETLYKKIMWHRKEYN